VGFFAKFIALALVALWLPVTLHCDLEAAGLLTAHDTTHATTDCCATTPSTDQPESCSNDGCELVENGLYRSSSALLQVTAPCLTTSTWFFCLQLATLQRPTEPVTPVVAMEQPPSWVPTWHFARRAAPLSRAPSFLV
jgi:hypothetical protein